MAVGQPNLDGNQCLRRRPPQQYAASLVPDGDSGVSASLGLREKGVPTVAPQWRAGSNAPLIQGSAALHAPVASSYVCNLPPPVGEGWEALRMLIMSIDLLDKALQPGYHRTTEGKEYTVVRSAGLTLILALIADVLVAGCSFAGAPKTLAEQAAPTLPQYVQQAPATVRETYLFAYANQDMLRHIPCYCGCGAVGHKSVRDCFVKEVKADGTVVWDSMGYG